jgi:hypothetical protein
VTTCATASTIIGGMKPVVDAWTRRLSSAASVAKSRKWVGRAAGYPPASPEALSCRAVSPSSASRPRRHGQGVAQDELLRPLAVQPRHRSLRSSRANLRASYRPGPLGPVIEGLLAKNPKDWLTAPQAQICLLHIQRESQLRTGSPGAEEQRRWGLEVDEERLQEFT